MTLKPWLALGVAVAGLVREFVLAWQVLPPHVALHWDFAGKPNAWGSKQAHLGLMAFIVFFVPVLWAMIALLIPHAPNENFNLPNKGYWLAPQRRKQTLQYISAQFVWLSVGLTAFWGGLLHLTTLANLSPDKTLPATVWLLVLLVVLFIFAWAYRFGKPFYRVPGK